MEDVGEPHHPTPQCGIPAKKRRASSKYRGVSKHVNTGMFEAHLWMATVRGEHRNGVQRYLGCFKSELEAARAYDLARIKMGDYTKNHINFGAHEYADELRALEGVSFEAFMYRRSEQRKHADRTPRPLRIRRGMRRARPRPRVPSADGVPAAAGPEHMLCTPPPTPFEPWTYDEDCVYV